jgi:sorting nexin-1/2
LSSRWPGIYIPPIPPKKAVVKPVSDFKGNKDDKFITERRFFLNKFLQELGTFDFLINCEEMKIFARPTGDIEKLLSSLAKPNSDLILDRYKNSLNVNLVRRITNNCK